METMRVLKDSQVGGAPGGSSGSVSFTAWARKSKGAAMKDAKAEVGRNGHATRLQRTQHGHLPNGACLVNASRTSTCYRASVTVFAGGLRCTLSSLNELAFEEYAS